MRKPVNNAIMRSGFGGRRHPILGYVKMHTGVDWATSYGTPIFASGNGVIEKAGPEGGYGKYIRIKHNNGYETAYGHMSAFAKGMEPGKKVRQGQVIGFVGSTGASTGPHVHYEILVNGRFVDPLRVKLPRGRSLEGPMLAGFEKGARPARRHDERPRRCHRPDVGRHRRSVAGHQQVKPANRAEIGRTYSSTSRI
ncbi:murein DD-endopeptidase MepM/ murein hydrolase activator NlpD [Bradyrhizobium sp. GM22.5]